MSFYFRGLLSGLTLALAACTSTLPEPPLVSETALTDISTDLRNLIRHDPELNSEFRHYLDLPGSKAFAVYSSDTWVASGYADKKLSLEIARAEALRLCRFFAHQARGCQIIHEESASALAPEELNSLPDEVISYTDLQAYRAYQAQPGHKAIAGNASGILGGGHAASRHDAERKALRMCQKNTHESIPECVIVASE